MQVHSVVCQRGGHHCSVVGSIVEFSCPCLFSALFTGPPLLEMKFYRKIFLNFKIEIYCGYWIPGHMIATSFIIHPVCYEPAMATAKSANTAPFIAWLSE